MTCANQI